jgi:hypothetical protein
MPQPFIGFLTAQAKAGEFTVRTTTRKARRNLDELIAHLVGPA